MQERVPGSRLEIRSTIKDLHYVWRLKLFSLPRSWFTGAAIATLAVALLLSANEECVAQPLVPTRSYVRVWLTSPQNMQVLAPSSSLEWQLWAQIIVGTDGSEGLAAIAVSMAQADRIVAADGTLPEPQLVRAKLFSGTTPLAMVNFDRPLGVANPPSPTSPGTNSSYGGIVLSLLDNDFETWLYQVGGAQNTTGMSLGPQAPLAAAASTIPMIAVTSAQLVSSGNWVVEDWAVIVSRAVQAGSPDRAFIVSIDILAPASYSTHVVKHGVGAEPSAVQFLPVVADVGHIQVIIACRADFNSTGDVTVQDVFDFIDAYFLGLPSADINGVGGVTIEDLFNFLDLYFAGC